MLDNLGKVGFVGRFKPLHLGGAILLEEVCKQAKYVLIGIGSSNKYNIRNPFTAEESEGMIRAVLNGFSNYDIIYVPDFAHVPEYKNGQEWKKFVLENFGKLDYFISGNDFVKELLRENYQLLHPYEIIPEEKRVRLRATEVRVEIARFGDWKRLVPPPATDYMERNGIVDRFRNEFGLATLATLSQDVNYSEEENLAEQIAHAGEI